MASGAFMELLEERLGKKLGFADELFKNIQVNSADEPLIEDILREINRGMWTIGYTGQSPERLKLQLLTSTPSTPRPC